MTPIRIDIWTDLSCPWCFIGTRRFKAAATAFAQARPELPPLEVTYRSFQVAPDLPDTYAGTVAEFLVEHEGRSPHQVGPILSHVTGVGREEGLAYDFDAVQQANTRLAHELAHAARPSGLAPQMIERLYRAHFLEGQHLGQVDTLVALAEEVGLDPAEVRRELADGRHTAQMQADAALARQLGIRGVPFFVIDDTFGMSGAQSVDAIVEVLERAARRRETSNAPV